MCPYCKMLKNLTLHLAKEVPVSPPPPVVYVLYKRVILSKPTIWALQDE